jgi:ComF family protein
LQLLLDKCGFSRHKHSFWGCVANAKNPVWAAIYGKYQKARGRCQPVTLSLVDRLLAGISPWRCVLCSDPAVGMDICEGCLTDLPWLGPACRGCGIPLPDYSLRLCGRCLEEPLLDACVAALAYEYPVAQMVAALKYRRDVTYARVLGELLSIRLQDALEQGWIELPDMLLPVPLHPFRQLRRTFNQAELIAQHVGRLVQVPVGRHDLRRIRNTPAQTSLQRSARGKNLRNSFVSKGDLAGSRVAVIDDVVTTGATAKELSRVLKRSGAAEVQIWAVARTL